jgi:4-hydroxybenzoate polyprenyltransferase
MNQILLISKSVKIHETLFSLPFAYFGCIYAQNGTVDWGVLFYVTIALGSARTFGMAINRYLDFNIDQLNIRTKDRPLASMRLSLFSIKIVIFFSSILFLLICFSLNKLAFYLSPLVLIIMFIYPYTKRFTFFCNFILGFILSIAPIGGSVAAAGYIEYKLLILSFGIFLWASSFDMIYHTQDYTFQKKNDLHSFSTKFGIKNTYYFSVLLDICSILIFILFGYLSELNYFYFIGCTLGFLIHLVKYIRNWPEFNDLELKPEFFRWNSSFSLIISSLAIVSIL